MENWQGFSATIKVEAFGISAGNSVICAELFLFPYAWNVGIFVDYNSH